MSEGFADGSISVPQVLLCPAKPEGLGLGHRLLAAPWASRGSAAPDDPEGNRGICGHAPPGMPDVEIEPRVTRLGTLREYPAGAGRI